MKDLVEELSLSEVIELHTTCSMLMRHQITEAGDNWLIVLNRDIGIEVIYRWSSFIGRAIGEDFRAHEFKKKARNLSSIIQQRFSQIGLDISLWSTVFFYLGMFYSYAKYIGFIKITHETSFERIQAISRIDPEFRSLITVDPMSDCLFIDSRSEDPMEVLLQLKSTGLLPIKKIDIFKGTISVDIDSFNDVEKVVVHQFLNEPEEKNHDQNNVEFRYY